jgi:hypothetical protein
MKLLVVAVLFSLQAAQVSPPVKPLAAKPVVKAARKGGSWYFAESGHAVYCMGPVVHMPLPDGGLQTVATFCQGDKVMVPLKD